jgi:hypothetical protein
LPGLVLGESGLGGIQVGLSHGELLLQGAGVEGGQGLAGRDVLTDGDLHGGDTAGHLE